MRPYLEDRHLVAVSGGEDSMALFGLCLHAKKFFNLKFAVAHIHHGKGAPQQFDFREKARKFVAEQCQTHGISFYTNESLPGDHLESELSLRDYRRGQLEEIRKKEGFQWILTGHHRQDIFETQLIRLVRGTGLEGLPGMVVVRKPWLRPLLPMNSSSLKQFLRESSLNGLEDPSNREVGTLRNWLRNRWLPELEAYAPGGVESFARSLDLILTQSPPLDDSCFQEGGLQMGEFWALDQAQQTRVLARYANLQGLRNYGLSHIKELLKRLDNPKKHLTFRMLGRLWVLDAGHLKVLGPEEIEPSSRK